MTHEFKKIIEEAVLAEQKGLKTVLASVVALDGSSYRRPGVRMLILENKIRHIIYSFGSFGAFKFVYRFFF